MTRHSNSKHQLKSRDTDVEFNEMTTSVLISLAEDSQQSLSVDECYTQEIRNKLKEYEFVLTESLLFKVMGIYKALKKTCSGENFYSNFYSSIVIDAESYFPGLVKPLCTLFATKLADKIFNFFNRPPLQVSATQPPTITEKEMDGLQYLAGYVVRKFLKKAKNHSNYLSAENQAIVTILNNAIIELHKTDQRLIKTLSRGGLVSVTKDCQQIFICAELKFRSDTTTNFHLQKINTEKMTLELMKSTEVVSFYHAIVDNSELKTVDAEIRDNLLENMLKLYFRVRTFSLVRDITEKHKVDLKRKKSKGGL